MITDLLLELSRWENWQRRFCQAKPILSAVVAIYLTGCGAAVEEVTPPTPDKTACVAPVGKQIKDVPSLIEWINAMPMPLSLPCFIESLPRPLKVYAALSGESAQPSIGDNNPRLFIFLDSLTLSIVPEERFATRLNGEPVDATSNKHNLLEVSMATSGIKSVKGEIKFPVREMLRNSAPYEQLAFGASASVCSLCHRNETKVDDIGGVPVYESDRLKPTLYVGLRAMRIDYETCATPAVNYHCNMLNSIFSPGEVMWQEFPQGLPDIFYR